MRGKESKKLDVTSVKVERDEKGRLLPGQSSLNPLGRPEGSFSLKRRIIERLEANPKEVKEIIDYIINKERALLFQMIDGRPPQDITSGGEKLPFTIVIDKPDDEENHSGETLPPHSGTQS